MFGSRNHPYTHPTASKVFEGSDGVREGGGGAKVKDFKGTYEAIEFKFVEGWGGTKMPSTDMHFSGTMHLSMIKKWD